MEDNFLQVTSWEYATLRAEAADCHKFMRNILQWGTTFMLTALGLVARYFPDILLWLLVVPPLFSLMYLGEMVRLNRAGRFIRFIEARVNKYLDTQYGAWSNVCKEMQCDISKYESELLVSGFGYDFCKPLFWEQWLATMRGKTPVSGHLEWLYVAQAAIFPGIFILILVIWVWLTPYSNYWYILPAGVTAILIVLYILLARMLRLA
jgi:hypothetical protein